MVRRFWLSGCGCCVKVERSVWSGNRGTRSGNRARERNAYLRAGSAVEAGVALDKEAEEVEEGAEEEAEGRADEEEAEEADEADVTVGNNPCRLATTLAASEKIESTLDMITALEALATDTRLATTDAAWLNCSLTTEPMIERERAEAWAGERGVVTGAARRGRGAVEVRVERREVVVEVRIRLDVLVDAAAAAPLELASCDAITAAAFALAHPSKTCVLRPSPYRSANAWQSVPIPTFDSAAPSCAVVVDVPVCRSSRW